MITARRILFFYTYDFSECFSLPEIYLCSIQVFGLFCPIPLNFNNASFSNNQNMTTINMNTTLFLSAVFGNDETNKIRALLHTYNLKNAHFVFLHFVHLRPNVFVPMHMLFLLVSCFAFGTHTPSPCCSLCLYKYDPLPRPVFPHET